MKAKHLIAIAVLSAVSAKAQWIVYDPTSHAQQIIDQAQDIAKYVEMVNNQVQQIQQLTAQLQELQQYNKAFGDPSRILNVTGVNGLVRDLRQSTVGKTITDLQRIAGGVEALTYDANGLYHQIGKTFTTPEGEEIERTVKDYKSFERRRVIAAKGAKGRNRRNNGKTAIRSNRLRGAKTHGGAYRTQLCPLRHGQGTRPGACHQPHSGH
jgi:hypothetical protein